MMSPKTSTAAIPVTMSPETSTMAIFQKMTERFLVSLNYRESDRNRLTNLLMQLGVSLKIFDKPGIQFRFLAAINSDIVPTLQEKDLYHFQIVEEMLTKQGQSSRKNQIDVSEKYL